MDAQRPESAAVSVDGVIDVIDEEDEATNTSDIGAAAAIQAADNTLRYLPPVYLSICVNLTRNVAFEELHPLPELSMSAAHSIRHVENSDRIN